LGPQGYARGDPTEGPGKASARVGFGLADAIFEDTSPTDTMSRMAVRTVLYARASSADQTVAHQRTQAEQAGFRLDEVVEDQGLSGVSTALRERPGGRRLFDLLRAGDILVVRWLDRLGRNYLDVSDTVREFIRRGVTIKTLINGLTFDGSTTDPMQMAVRDALIGFMAAMAQAQAQATREAQKAGIAHARANDAGKRFRGRKPTFSPEDWERVQDLLGQGVSVSIIAKTTGLKRQSVYRIKSDPAGTQAALQSWYPKTGRKNDSGHDEVRQAL
jgi:putative DNA-invertase from lambdoid prophage Rac